MRGTTSFPPPGVSLCRRGGSLRTGVTASRGDRAAVPCLDKAGGWRQVGGGSAGSAAASRAGHSGRLHRPSTARPLIVTTCLPTYLPWSVKEDGREPRLGPARPATPARPAPGTRPRPGHRPPSHTPPHCLPPVQSVLAPSPAPPHATTLCQAANPRQSGRRRKGRGRRLGEPWWT